MKKILALAAMLGVLGTTQAATKVLYICGATAFRGVEFSTLNNNIIAAGKEVVGISSDNQFSFSGTWTNIGAGTSYPIKVYCSYSGSVEGQQALLTGAVQTFKHLPIADGSSATFTHAGTLSFSDSFQETSQYGTAFGFAALNDTVIAIQPFVFCQNKLTHNGAINNMNDHAFRIMAAAGYLPQTYFLGDGNADPVYLSGRNNLSGTRTVVFSETGYGVFSGCQQYSNGGKSGAYPTTARVGDQDHVTALSPDDGWSSGSNVRADCNNLTSTNKFVGYLSAGDARSLFGPDLLATGTDFSGWYMTYEGIAYTKANVENGSYTLWGYEHAFTTGADADANAFAPNFATAVDGVLTTALGADNFPAGIPLSAMNVGRSAELSGVASGPVL